MLFPLYDLNPHHRLPWLTLVIIGVNVAVTGWMSTLPDVEQGKLALSYGFVPARLSQLDSGKPVFAQLVTVDPFTGQKRQHGVLQLSTIKADVYATFLTTMFLHGGWIHLLTNMWMLWIFGNNIEDRLGHFMYVAFYLTGGLVATLCYWFSDPNSGLPVVGASGAVAAVLGGYAVTFPSAKVRTLIFFVIITIIDLPALVVLGVWFVLQIFSGVMGLWGVVLEPVAFWAHIGGFVAGMFLMPLLSIGASPPGTDWRKESDDMFQFDDPRLTESRRAAEQKVAEH
jgi:membrane associated rhomboid family serine protease